MKRLMVVALMTLCMASLARAVAINWTDGTPNQGNGTITLDNTTDTFVLSVKVLLHSSVTNVSQNDAIFTFGGDTNNGIIAYNKGGTAQLAAHIGARWLNKGNGSDGEHTVKLEFTRNDTANGWTVAMWLNGILVGGNSGEYNWQSNDVPELSDNAMGFSGNTFKIYAGHTDAFEVTGVEIVQLPEPTTLALLALGVAGLALRRKVA